MFRPNQYELCSTPYEIYNSQLSKSPTSICLQTLTLSEDLFQRIMRLIKVRQFYHLCTEVAFCLIIGISKS